MRKSKALPWILFSFSLLLLLTLAAGFILDADKVFESISFALHSDQGDELICLHVEEDCTAFLPSYASYDDVRVRYDSGYRLFVDGAPLGQNESIGRIAPSVTHRLEIRNRLGLTIGAKDFTVMQAKNVPSMSIVLRNGTIQKLHKNKDKKLSGKLMLTTPDGSRDYDGSLKAISGRGNSTWGRDKKPYNIELASEADLLGMGKGVKWCLLANDYDSSNLRNKLVLDTAKKFGLSSTPDGEWVDLFINGEYLGLYLLTEKVQVADGRLELDRLQDRTQNENVHDLKSYPRKRGRLQDASIAYTDIPNNPSDISGGYLFEFALANREKDNYLTTAEGQTILMDYPKYVSYAQTEYLTNYLNAIEKDIYETGDLQNIDLDSFARVYIIQEFFANTDKNSFFFYKDSDKVDSHLYAGPLWDFDLTIGSTWLGKDTNPAVFYTNTWGWFREFYKNEAFLDMVKTLYDTQFESLARAIPEQLSQYVQTIAQSDAMNRKRWKNEKRSAWFNDKESLQEHSDYIENYLSDRMTFFDAVLYGNLQQNRVVFKSEYNNISRFYYSVPVGEALETVPTLQCDGATLLGWKNAVTGEEYVPGHIVEENEEYIAQWDVILNDNDPESAKQKGKDLKAALALFAVLCGCILLFLLKEWKNYSDGGSRHGK